MADVRALLAAERQARRISHPHLSYSKSGALTCTACNLNIKSEQLWPGHLKSANHRANVQKANDKVQPPAKPLKRKLDDAQDRSPVEREHDLDSRKKPKPTAQVEVTPPEQAAKGPEQDTVEPQLAVPSSDTNPPSQLPPAASAPVDEDEWAAFERDVASVSQRDYSSATITAAPVSAAEIAAQQETVNRQRPEDEAEEEKEEESRRMEDEFEVMEEMEERVRRLKEKREALRSKHPTRPPPDISIQTSTVAEEDKKKDDDDKDDDDDDDDDENDDWYA